MMLPALRMSALAALLLSASLAHAQYSVPSQASSGQQLIMVQPEVIKEKPSRPVRWELGASLNFVTSEPSLGDKKLDFTDLVFLRIHSLVSVSDATELFAGVDILPKQPSYTDELIWQGALVGARTRLGDRFAAWARGQGGPQLGREGFWIMGDMAVQYQRSLEKVLFWESSLGGTYTQLFFDQDQNRPVAEAFWLAEIMAQTGIALREPRGRFGMWLTFAFHFPVISRPGPQPDPAAGSYLDPQTRVNVQLGMLAGVAPTVDLFIEWSILDRGDLEAPATTLPIANGGFDQHQLVFGFMRRFGR